MTIHEQIEKIFDDNDIKGLAVWYEPNTATGRILIQAMQMSEFVALIASLIHQVAPDTNRSPYELCDEIKNTIKLVREEQK